MKNTELACLEANLKDIFDRRTNLAVDEAWVVIGEDQVLQQGDAIEEYLYGDSESSLLTGGGPSVAHLQDALASIDEPWVSESSADSKSPPASGLIAGTGHPGTPGALRPRPDEQHIVPPPDCYAFYLPWHYFTGRNWGIYLLVDGIMECGRSIERTACGGLTPAEARKAAKAFLFHHEAYHNAVETFSVRVEVSHRVPCYRRGFETLYRSGFGKCAVHEEGLATAYAANKVRTQVFADIPVANIRKLKRQIAFKALKALVGNMPAEYASAVKLLPNSSVFNDGEQLFQESAHNESLPSIPGLKPAIWASALHSMGPSLQRNKSFSYLIHRAHPAVRDLLAAKYLSVKRKHFLQRLRDVVGGEEVGGGRHPKWQAATGRKVPVPSGTDLNPYTCAQILKQFGLSQGIHEFMQS